jgi:hypothetical protein
MGQEREVVRPVRGLEENRSFAFDFVDGPCQPAIYNIDSSKSVVLPTLNHNTTSENLLHLSFQEYPYLLPGGGGAGGFLL